MVMVLTSEGCEVWLLDQEEGRTNTHHFGNSGAKFCTFHYDVYSQLLHRKRTVWSLPMWLWPSSLA